jgi:hypothetical protein
MLYLEIFYLEIYLPLVINSHLAQLSKKKKNPQTKKSDEFLSPDYLMFYLIGEVFTMPMVCLLIMWV